MLILRSFEARASSICPPLAQKQHVLQRLCSWSWYYSGGDKGACRHVRRPHSRNEVVIGQHSRCWRTISPHPMNACRRSRRPNFRRNRLTSWRQQSSQPLSVRSSGPPPPILPGLPADMDERSRHPRFQHEYIDRSVAVEPPASLHSYMGLCGLTHLPVSSNCRSPVNRFPADWAQP